MKWLRLTQSSSSLTVQSDKTLRIFDVFGGFGLIVLIVEYNRGEHASRLRRICPSAPLIGRVVGYRIPLQARQKGGDRFASAFRGQGALQGACKGLARE